MSLLSASNSLIVDTRCQGSEDSSVLQRFSSLDIRPGNWECECESEIFLSVHKNTSKSFN